MDKISIENLENIIEEQTNKIKPMVHLMIDKTDVDDVIQDIRLSFVTAFPRFRGESKLSTYAHIIAKRRVIDYFREKYKRKKIGGLNEVYGKAKKNSYIEPNEGEYCDLTEREKEILKLVGEGMNNNEIAKTLDIKIYTVRSHLKNVYLKLQCRGRVKLALFSYKFFRRRDNEN